MTRSPKPSGGQSVRAAIAGARSFFLVGIWQAQLDAMPRWKALAIRVLRVISASMAEFFNDQCLLRASALTFYTLLSIVPIFAVIFGIAKGFGFEKVLEKELMEQMAGQEQALERILAFSRNMLENTKGGLLAGIGIAVMFWSAIKVLGQIESALNAMWDVRRPRSWGRRFSDYLAMVLIAALLLLVASSASVFIRTQFDLIAARFEILGFFSPLVFQLLRLTPIVLVCALFTLVYKVMPNARVELRAALTGGAVGGALYQVVQWIYIDFQVGAAKQSAIYGSFAALPLFLAWVQMSWTILLFGAELCYAVQHSQGYCSASGCPAPAPAEKKLIGLHIARLVIRNFADGGRPMTINAIARGSGVPARLVLRLVADLVERGIFSETRSPGSHDPAFQPAMDIQRLTVHSVAEAIDSAGGTGPGLNLPPDVGAGLKETLSRLNQAAAASPANRLLKDL